jgi:ParB-like chromosome segregation protein Spo0J
VLQPIVINSKHELILGQRRLEAAKLLGWRDVPALVAKSFDDVLAALIAERDENTCRKDFTPSEAVAIGKAIEELEKPKAKERQKAKLKKGSTPPVVESCHDGESNGKTRDKVAAAVGMSGKTYEKAKVVVDAAEQDPEQFVPVKEEMDRTGKVDPAYQKVTEKRSSDEVIKSWRQQPDESTADWCKRLAAVPEKDKKGRKRDFDYIRRKAEHARFQEEEREHRRQRSHERFDIFTESEKFYKLLVRRREEWPERFQGDFILMVRSCLERMEIEDDAQARLGEALADA